VAANLQLNAPAPRRTAATLTNGPSLLTATSTRQRQLQPEEGLAQIVPDPSLPLSTEIGKVPQRRVRQVGALQGLTRDARLSL
jgi:hypothetical protein